MASSFKSPILQAIDQNGDPVPGAKLFVFATGTTTPVAVFSDEALSVALPNPIIANARGYFASAGGVVQNIFWSGQDLRLRLTDPADAVIWEIDNYSAETGATIASANETITGIWAGMNALSLEALKARNVAGLTSGDAVQLVAGGRSGFFSWVAGNQSANVANDPQEGMFVAPDTAPTGASGAWRRINVPYVDGWVNVEWFGAVGDVVRRSGGNITSGTTAFTSSSSVFAAGDVGKPIHIAGAGAAGGALVTTIAAFVSGTAVTLADAASTTVAGGATYAPLTAGSFAFGTNAQPAFQAAVNWIASTTGKLRGGVVQYSSKPYWIDGTIAINERGIALRGTLPERTGANTSSVINGGVLVGAAALNPIAGVWNDDIVLEDVEIGATPGRASAALSRGPRTTNCGVSIETADSSGAVMVRPLLKRVLVRDHPAEGFLLAGDIVQASITDCVAIKIGGHGISIDRGDINSRVNKARPGLGLVTNFRVFDSGGHGVAIGTTANTADRPYRWTLQNIETFRNAQSASVRFLEASNFLNGEQIVAIACAFGGSRETNTAAQPCLAVAGRDVQLLSNRYIESAGAGHVLIKNYSGLATRMIKIIGGYASTTADTMPTNFAVADAGCGQIEIDGVGGDDNYTDLFSPTSLDGLRLTDYRSPTDFTTRYFNAPQDFAGTTVTIDGGNIRGLTGTMDPFATVTGNEYLRIVGATGSSQVSGILRLTQVSGSTGDSAIRTDVGSTVWLFGARRSGSTWSLANSTAFSNAGNIINVLGDSGNGLVGFGPNTTVPGFRIDVDGDINVRTGGAFRFAGTQVVGARVINAALSNTANSGDANTDALIEALKAIITTHGLGAAS